MANGSKLGLFGQVAANRRHKRSTSPRFTKGIFGPAIEELKVSLDTVETNAPINEREGDARQAKLERQIAKSCKAAIGFLKQGANNGT